MTKNQALFDNDVLVDLDSQKDDFENLHCMVKKTREENGIFGFILKGSARAIVDMDNPEESTKLAVLVSQLSDFSEKVLNIKDEGATRSAVLEGREVKVLCLTIRGKQIGVLMEKSKDEREVLAGLL